MLAIPPDPSKIALLREMAAGPNSAVFAALWAVGTSPGIVAVKVVRPTEWSQIDALLDVRDRGRGLSRLRHPNIVSPTELLRVGDYPALVSPWLDGVDLLDWVEILRETGTILPGRVICEIVREVAKALEAALHQAPWPGREPLRVIHADLKPANVFVGRSGNVCVTDFGSGYVTLGGSTARTGALKRGLLKYLSPERREGGTASPGGDVYALGILAVELFRGRWLRRLRMKNPAHDRHLTEVVATIGRMDMRSTADDQTLRSVLLRMVAHDPDARPPAAEVAQTFRILADRASGPGLEHFAHDQLVPWLEPIPTRPGPELQRIGLTQIRSSEHLRALPEPRAPLDSVSGDALPRSDTDEGLLLDTADFTGEAPLVGDPESGDSDELMLETPEPPSARTGFDEPTTWSPAMQMPAPRPAVDVEMESVHQPRRASDRQPLLFAVAGLTMGLALGGSLMFVVAWMFATG